MTTDTLSTQDKLERLTLADRGILNRVLDDYAHLSNEGVADELQSTLMGEEMTDSAESAEKMAWLMVRGGLS